MPLEACSALLASWVGRHISGTLDTYKIHRQQPGVSLMNGWLCRACWKMPAAAENINTAPMPAHEHLCQTAVCPSAAPCQDRLAPRRLRSCCHTRPPPFLRAPRLCRSQAASCRTPPSGPACRHADTPRRCVAPASCSATGRPAAAAAWLAARSSASTASFTCTCGHDYNHHTALGQVNARQLGN